MTSATRRWTTMMAAALTAALMMQGGPAQADRFHDEAADFVAELGRSVASIVEGGDPSASATQQVAQLTAIFDQSVDLATMAHFALGSYWSGASEEQRGRFTHLLRASLVDAVVNHANQFLTSEPVQVDRVIEVNNTRPRVRDVMVLSKLRSAQGHGVNMAWRVRQGDSGPMIIDMVINGISLLTVKRDEYVSLLRANDGDIPTLLAKMQERMNAERDVARNAD